MQGDRDVQNYSQFLSMEDLPRTLDTDELFSDGFFLDHSRLLDLTNNLSAQNASSPHAGSSRHTANVTQNGNILRPSTLSITDDGFPYFQIASNDFVATNDRCFTKRASEQVLQENIPKRQKIVDDVERTTELPEDQNAIAVNMNGELDEILQVNDPSSHGLSYINILQDREHFVQPHFQSDQTQSSGISKKDIPRNVLPKSRNHVVYAEQDGLCPFDGHELPQDEGNWVEEGNQSNQDFMAELEEILNSLPPTKDSLRNPDSASRNVEQDEYGKATTAAKTFAQPHTRVNTNQAFQALQPGNYIRDNDPSRLIDSLQERETEIMQRSFGHIDDVTSNMPLQMSDEVNVASCAGSAAVPSANGRSLGIVIGSEELEGYGYKVVKVNNTVNCGHCGQQCATAENLRNHIERSHPTKIRIEEKHKSSRVACIECSAFLMNDVNLRRHVANVHNPEAITDICSLCCAKFSSRYAFVKHRKDVHGIEPASAKKKKRALQTKQNLFTGVMGRGRKALTVYTCDSCDRHFDNKGNIKRHIKIMHIKLREYECSTCGKKCATKNNLQNHQTAKSCRKEG